jgi:hypothetical protein
VGEFLRDYVNILPAVIAVINGALAVFSTHYPFKTPAARTRFICVVAALSVAAIGATFYSQHSVIAQRAEEQIHRKAIREELGTFINEGNNLMRECATERNRPLASDQRQHWLEGVVSFLSKELGYSYVARFADQTGVPNVMLIGANDERQSFWYSIYAGVYRLEQFSQELPSS